MISVDLDTKQESDLLSDAPVAEARVRTFYLNDPAAVVFDDDEHVQRSECAGHRDKEITGDDTPRVVAKEGRPPPRHVLRYRARRHLKTEI